MAHPVEAKRIGDLGIDYAVDWVRTWLLRQPGDPGYSAAYAGRVAEAASPPALLRVVREELSAAVTLSGDAALRQELSAIAAALPRSADGWEAARAAVEPLTARLGEWVMRREADKPYRIDRPLDLQVSPDSTTLICTLALARHALAAGAPIPLAAPLLPRAAVPPRGPVGGPEVVEVGDLGDPFFRAGHGRVPGDLARAGVRPAWRWVAAPSARHAQDSESMAALLEAVLALAPGRFWETVDRLCETTPYGALRGVRALLAEVGIDAERLDRRLADEANLEGVRYDRSMALACGLPWLRPVFVVGRRLFVGLDAGRSLGEHLGGRAPG